MKTYQLESAVDELLDAIGLMYVDLTPYQKEKTLSILEDFVDGSDVVSERYDAGYDKGYDEGFKEGVDNERGETESKLDDEYDKGFEAGAIRGYKEGYEDARNEFEHE